MEWFEIELNGHRTTTFSELSVPWFSGNQEERQEQLLQELSEEEKSASLMGGIIFGGKWGWLTRRYASDCTLIICCLETGYIIARHIFWSAFNQDDNQDNDRCSSIRCVEELYPEQATKQQTVLAICLETWTRGNRLNTIETHLAIYSVKYNQVLRHIHLDGTLASTLNFVNPELSWRTPNFRNFDGCLAIGSEEGVVLIMDLNFQYILGTRQKDLRDSIPDVEIQRLSSPYSNNSFDSWIRECRENDNHLAVEINVAQSEISSLVVIDLIDGFAAGLENGQIILYDLKGIQIITCLRMSADLGPLSVARLCCIVPPDDPRPCFYLSAMYQSEEKLLALLHVISFRRPSITPSHVQRYNFEFQSSSTCARLLLDGPSCRAIGCSTASTASIAGDNGTLLVILSWYSQPDERNKLLLFDINQWYRDEMPYLIRSRDRPNCLAGFVLSERHHMGFGLQLKPSSILHFESLQRSDVHYYPNSLTFDCCLLTVKGYRYYAHNGVQNRFINCLRQQNATLFLQPQCYHEDIIRLRLMPQFSELNPNATYSKLAMHEEILSVALEHKCLALLYDCARSWLDDSFLCNKINPSELSVDTLTNWLVKRAKCIKTRCLELCQGIYDYNGYSLDERERKEFQILTSQLRDLLELQSFIIKKGKSVLADSVLQEMETNESALKLVYHYQWMLYWFMERGLLPEGNLTAEQAKQTQLKQLQRDYDERRIRRKSSNMALYIDTLLQRNGLENQSYPPPNMQALMQMMLSTDALLEQKHEVILYLLMDLDRANQGMSVELEQTKSPPVQTHEKKMQMVLSKQFYIFFNLSEQLIKSVKSFWYLDRGDYWQSIDGLYDGRCKIRHYEDWQMKLLIDNLLSAGASRLAMRLVVQPPGPISFSLYLRVLLANDRISEAFHHARLYDDDKGRPLLEHFFRHFIKRGKFKVLAELSLREDEEQIVYRLLREFKTRKTDSVHLILLLQRFKYVEAVSFMDEIAVERQQAANEASNNILSAYRSTMAPVTQSIAGTYFQIRNRLDGRDVAANLSPEPFSCQLVKQSASNDMVGGIFQSSALSAHWATTNLEPNKRQLSLNCQNVPFLRNAQYRGHLGDGDGHLMQHRRHIIRSVPYQPVLKRQREKQDSELESKPASYTLQPRKRRRLLGEQLISDIHEFVNRKKIEEQAKEKATATNEQAAERMELLKPRGIFKRHSPLASTEQPSETQEQSLSVAEKVVNLPETGKDYSFPPPIPLDDVMEEETDEIIMEIRSRGGNQSETRKNTTKDFYFSPPIPLDTIEREPEEEQQPQQEQEQAEEEEEEVEEEEHDEIFVEFQSRDGEQQIAANRVNQQASSVTDDSEEEEEEEFVSPMTSANVSLVQEQEAPLPMAPPTGPQPRQSLLLQHGRTESSSGFGSFSATSSMRLAHTASSRDFVPTVCSSKMGETYVKISERTTICGELPEITVPSQIPSVTTTTSLGWSLIPARTGQLQDMLDTTLGMSSYDITSLEPRQEEEEEQQQPTIEQMEVEEQQANEVVEQKMESQQQELDEEEEEEQPQQQQQTIEVDEENSSSYHHHPFITTSTEGADAVMEEGEVSIAVDSAHGQGEQLSSPTFSVSSELSSNSSSTEVRPLVTSRLQDDDPMYSIVVESTGSITTSRSVTHTPTSFLPSDTNVSQNSSPRAAPSGPGGGIGGDASPRSLYRANSLETVDDLDITKGSLDDDDDEEAEDEDDCVVAMDGTEVRGYVPRPQHTAGQCSSAELFAFKDDEAAAGLGSGARPNASLSLGATANSDSVIAETINLDTEDEDDNNEKVHQFAHDESLAMVAVEPDEIQEEEEEPISSDSLVIVTAQPDQLVANQPPQLKQIPEESSSDDSLVIVANPPLEGIREKEHEQDKPHDQIQEDDSLIIVANPPLEQIQEEEDNEEAEFPVALVTKHSLEEIQEVEEGDSEVLSALNEIPEEKDDEMETEIPEEKTKEFQSLEEIQEVEEDDNEVVPALKEIPEEKDDETEMRHRKNSESDDPPLKLAFSDDDEQEPTNFLPTPVRTLRSHDSPRVATPPVDLGMGLRRLKRRLHSDDVSTNSPTIPALQSPSSSRITRATSTPPSSARRLSTQKQHLLDAIEEQANSSQLSALQSPLSSNRITRATSTPPSSSRPVRRLSTQKQPLLDAIDEQTNPRDGTHSPGPQTRSRSRLSLEAEQVPPPTTKVATTFKTRTAKRANSTASGSRTAMPPLAPSYRRKLRSSSEPPTSLAEENAKVAPLIKRGNKRRPSATSELGLDQPLTSNESPPLRVRRLRNSESERAPSPSPAMSAEDINPNPTSSEDPPPVDNNEANVPPKKRGRPRNKTPNFT